MAEEVTEETTTEGTTGGNYLTRSYLVRNLQNFWNKIKAYITDQTSGFVNKSYVDGAVGSKADQDDLSSLATTVGGKADKSALAALATLLDEKVDKVTGKGLSTNDFTDADKTKLNSLTNDVATESANGLMSADDKVKLNSIAAGATAVTVDSVWDPTSENPAQSKAISEVLNGKVDKEANPLDPTAALNNTLNWEGNSKGDIILKFSNTIKHLKIHTESDEVIEKFNLSFKNDSDKIADFNTFEENTFQVRIPNPDGNDVLQEGRKYKFYVECFELSNKSKYKPFILMVERDSDTPTNLYLSVYEK